MKNNDNIHLFEPDHNIQTKTIKLTNRANEIHVLVLPHGFCESTYDIMRLTIIIIIRARMVHNL